MWTSAVQNSDELLFTYGLYIFHMNHYKMHHIQGYFSRTFPDLEFSRKNPWLSRRLVGWAWFKVCANTI